MDFHRDKISKVLRFADFRGLSFEGNSRLSWSIFEQLAIWT